MALVGMGIHKNIGVADGFHVAHRGRQQTNVRVSRALEDDLTPTIGPLSSR